MKTYELKKLIPFLYRWNFEGMSTTMLLSCVRMYISLYNLITVNGLDEEYGDRTQASACLKQLFVQLHRRYRRAKQVTEKARLLRALYTIATGTAFVAANKDEDTCHRYASQLIADYLEQNADESQAFDEEACRAMLYIVDAYFYMNIDEDDPEPEFLSFRRHLDRWVEEWSEEGSWSSLSLEAALQRIELLNMNSYMFLDSRHDETLRSAYHHYSTAVLKEHSEDLLLLSRLYALTEEVCIDGDYRSLRQEVRSRMDAATLPFARNVEDYLMYVSTWVTHACHVVEEEIQDSF